MTPLQITARLSTAISLPGGHVHLDSLLMAAVAQRDGLPPLPHPDPQPIEIPVARSACGRVYLASASVQAFEHFEVRWTNRRFPVEQAQMIGSPKIRRLAITAGAAKSYRLPLEQGHLVDDRMDWWCVGDADAIRDLLAWIGYLGKKRSVGLGRVRSWTVEPCEPWGEGFPVAREGQPLRTLPADWPGLVEPALAYQVPSPPYYERHREVLCAVPG